MDIKNKYTHYSADQLLNDFYFLESEQHPSPESIAFWETMQQKDKALAKEIKIARSFLHDIRHIPVSHLPQNEVETVWKNISRLNNIEKQRKKKILFINHSILVAASLALILCSAWYFQSQLSIMQEKTELEITAVKRPNATPTDNIQLVLSKKKQIDIDGKESQLQYDHQGKINVNSQTIIQETDDKEKTNIYNQLIVPAGKRSSITFTDGTCIWLSANSRIVYPVEFKQHKREIYIEGEAFLSVSHDPNRPFIVKTSQMDIQVLGTTFNVSAYENKQTQSVVLVSGKIKVKTSKNESKTLSPNNLLSYNEQEGIHIQSVDVQKYIAWKDGFYLFQTEKLKDIATKLSDYYGKKIMIDSPLKTITCSGKLDLKEDLDEVLQTQIRTVPARIEKSDGIIHIYVIH